MPHPVALSALRRQRGVSLIEVMVGLTIGLVITAALISLFTNISTANREQFKAAVQIENGRYAMDLLTNDLRLAGFYGNYASLPPVSSSLPDPCDLTTFSAGSVGAASTGSPFAYYVQTYPAASLLTAPTVPTVCTSWMDAATLSPGSDVLVIRRLETAPLIEPTAAAPNPTATPVAGQYYAQTNFSTLSLQQGTSPATAIDKTKNATGAASAAAFLRKDYTQATTGTPPTRPVIAEQIRKVRIHVYFVAKCRVGSGTNGRCTPADDTVPTLKRLELSASNGSPVMSLVSLVDGIEFLKVYLGIDSTADGQMDGSLVAAPSSQVDWQNVVQAELRLVARNLEASNGSDTKVYDLGGGLSYDLGSASFSAAARYRRQLYTQQVYIVNIAGRRES